MTVTTSIIMTVYNRERYLGAAIASVLAQTYDNWELIVWDDGSTDSSLEIAHHYANQDKRIRVVAREHQGRAPSLYAAHAAAEGDYLGWVDSDDLLAPTAIAETIAILDTNPEVGLVYTDYLAIDELEQVRGYGQHCRIPYSKERLLVDFMTFHFRLFRRDVFNAAGGIDPAFPIAVDYDLCLRISEVTEVFHLRKPLYFYRYHKSSMTYQKRMEQILWSQEAIALALSRRGMSDQYEIDVQIVGKYSLRQRLGERTNRTDEPNAPIERTNRTKQLNETIEPIERNNLTNRTHQSKQLNQLNETIERMNRTNRTDEPNAPIEPIERTN